LVTQGHRRTRARTVPGAMFRVFADEISSDSGDCDSNLEEVGAATNSDDEIRGNVWLLAQDREGCWKVQQALDDASRDEDHRAIASELEGHVWEAAHDSNANYVLQKLIMVSHQKSIQFIIDELVLRFPGAAACASRDKFACRVIQRLLEFCSPDRVGDIGEHLLQDVVGNCQDRYGKYAMQCLLEHGTVCQHQRLVSLLSAHMDVLGGDMNAQSVVAKALSTGALEEQQALANLIVSKHGLVKKMLQCKNGHYAGKLALQLSNLCGSMETPTDSKNDVQEHTTSAPVVPTTTQPAQARSRRRGKKRRVSEQA